MAMLFGNLNFVPVLKNPELLAEPVREYLTGHAHTAGEVWISEIDPSLADTAAFCEYYHIGLDVSANCVVVEAKRADRVWHAACVVLATDKIDVNGAVRKILEARRVSFAPMDAAIALSGMEYGGVSPIGLPMDWPIFIDQHAMGQEKLIVGSGIRGSKLLVTPSILAGLPQASIAKIAKA